MANGSDAALDNEPDGIPDKAQGSPPAPNSSDAYIVSKTQYDAAGNAYRSTDNKGHITELTFDLAGRQTKMVENYVNGTASETETDTDRTTVWVYVSDE